VYINPRPDAAPRSGPRGSPAIGKQAPGSQRTARAAVEQRLGDPPDRGGSGGGRPGHSHSLVSLALRVQHQENSAAAHRCFVKLDRIGARAVDGQECRERPLASQCRLDPVDRRRDSNDQWALWSLDSAFNCPTGPTRNPVMGTVQVNSSHVEHEVVIRRPRNSRLDEYAASQRLADPLVGAVSSDHAPCGKIESIFPDRVGLERPVRVATTHMQREER